MKQGEIALISLNFIYLKRFLFFHISQKKQIFIGQSIVKQYKPKYQEEFVFVYRLLIIEPKQRKNLFMMGIHSFWGTEIIKKYLKYLIDFLNRYWFIFFLLYSFF